MILDGSAGIAESRVGAAEIAQRIAFAAPVAKFACDHKLLSITLDGAAGLAELRMRSVLHRSSCQLPSRGRRCAPIRCGSVIPGGPQPRES